MGDLNVQQTRILNAYLAKHKNVSRQNAGITLFQGRGGGQRCVAQASSGTTIEHSKATNAKPKQTTNYNVKSPQVKQQGEKLAADLHEQIEGASINSNTIKLLKQIKPTNVLYVLDAYNKQTKGKETLAQAIDNEWGLDIITVKEYICPQLVALAKNKGITGIYYGDYMKLNDIKALNEWIENAKTKIKIALEVNSAETTVVKKGPVDIDISNATKSKSVKQINKLGLAGKEVREEFEKRHGISLNQALLTDPSISKADKINAIRNSFTYYSKVADRHYIEINDIINDANKDLQALAADGDFKKYAPLYDTTLARLEARISRSFDDNSGSAPVNGKIDKDFQQGEVGDCWLLASIKAISRNPKGLKILNDSVKLQNNGNVTVHLKGVGKTYEIKKQEIENAKELSTGDGDVRAIEIAVNRYLRETYKYEDGKRASIDGNVGHAAYQILTGNGEHFFELGTIADRIVNSEFYGNTPITDNDIKSFNDKDTITCVSARGNKDDVTIFNKNDKSYALLTTQHAYTVVRSDEKYVYLINPWDTSKEIPVDIKTFKDFFSSIDKFKL